MRESMLKAVRWAGQTMVSAAGHRGRFLSAGNGPVVVVLASMIVGARSYRATLAQLAQSARTVVLEMPGCGLGSRLPAAWTPVHYAEWLLEALEALNIDRCTLVGHSNSGPVALVAAALQPTRIERLVLVDSIGAQTSSIGRLVLRRTIDSWFEHRATPVLLQDALWNSTIHGMNFRAQIGMAGRFCVTPWTRRVLPPTLLTWGGRDRTLPLAHLQRLRELLPKAAVHVEPEGRHDWLIEYPQPFARAVGGFLSACAEARPSSAGSDA